ncbi:MAG TPA: phosphatase PAP2-related protein [Mucilaginibacter sp.]
MQRAKSSIPDKFILVNRFIATPYFKTWLGFISICILLSMLPAFFMVIEKRQGILLHDFILNALPAHNVSSAIFLLIWGMGLLMFYRAIQNPALFPVYIWAYLFVCLCRVIAITIVPLAPPLGLIPLKDPLTGIFYGERIITKDLFYSGHTATLFLIFLALERKWDKIIALIALILLIVLLLIQHVHYTIDIIGALIIVFLLYRFTLRFLKIFDHSAK